MNGWTRWFQHLANLLVGGTGLVYFVARYLLEPADEFALAHPLVPHAQHLHVLAAPLLVFATGLLWQRHVSGRWQNPALPRRLSGLGLVAAFVPMAASGYLLQISVEPGWRAAWTWIHVATSVLWIAGYVAHQLGRRTARGALQALESEPERDSPPRRHRATR